MSRSDLMSPPPSKLGAVLAGVAVIVVVGLATPIVLGTVTASLWSHSGVFEVSSPVRIALFVLVGVAWIAWLRIVIDLALDVAAGLRHPYDVRTAVGLRGHLAGWVLGFTVLVLPASILGAGVAGATTTAQTAMSLSAIDATGSLAPVSGPTSAAPSDSAGSPVSGETPVLASSALPSSAATSEATYTVVSGDCLSTIALRFYGTEDAWHQIWAANANRVMGGGMRFGDPNLIYAGWTLILPGRPAPSPTEPPPPDPMPSPSTQRSATAVAPSPTTASSEPDVQGGGAGPDDRSGNGASVQTSPSPGASQSRHGQSRVIAPDQPGTQRGPSGGNEAPLQADGDGHSAASHDRDGRSAASHDGDGLSGAVVRWVPESASLGVSVLVAAAYVRRIRRRRAQARAARGDDEVVADPDEAAVTLESRLAPFADAPVFEWLELANRHLTAALRAEMRGDVPSIRVVRVGPDGVDLRLDEPVDWAPASFVLGDDKKSWRLPADVDGPLLWSDASRELAWLPLLVPVGDDADGTYLLHLEPGDVVSLEGPRAPSMLAAWVEAAKSWPWAEQIGVAREPETAEAMAPLFAGQNTFDERATVLFIGDPGVLTEAARVIAGSVTSSAGAWPARVTVSAEEAIIEPLGIAVRPCGLDAADEEALAGVDDLRLIPVGTGNPDSPDPKPTRSMQRVEEVAPLPLELPSAGPIEVRLLTFTPQIIGLAEPLPSSMAVRITELVAWLALQGDKGTTSASMLDHGIAGASSTKTLYNVISAARAALGTDRNGASRLITDRSTGTYRLTSDVTVDVLRFEEMAARGIEADNPDAITTLCREALSLIDDTPVGNGSGRYGWWSSLWEARVGRLAVKAAGCLAELARLELIELQEARTGIERARHAAEGEGELHRVAMVLEAWAGADERVEHEWEAACAQAEDLEPGSVPSGPTESVFLATRGCLRGTSPAE